MGAKGPKIHQKITQNGLFHIIKIYSLCIFVIILFFGHSTVYVMIRNLIQCMDDVAHLCGSIGLWQWV